MQIIKEFRADRPLAQVRSGTMLRRIVTNKQKQLAEQHGTPEQFESAIWQAYNELMITAAEADGAIQKYRADWDAAGTALNCTSVKIRIHAVNRYAIDEGCNFQSQPTLSINQ